LRRVCLGEVESNGSGVHFPFPLPARCREAATGNGTACVT
jgi:hypothetical protein